jgi:hypothetical protein
VNKREKIIIQFINDTSVSNLDFKWKLRTFLKSGDLSFLGKKMEDLNEKLEKKVSAKISKNVTS